MALTSTGFKLTVTLSDQGGNKSTLKYDLTSADFATATTDASTIIAALDAVTTAAITTYSLAEKFDDPAASFGTGHVEDIALVVARIDSTEKKYANVKIPAPADGIFLAVSGDDYNEVDAADTDLVAYLQVFQTGGESLLSDGEALLTPGTAGMVTGKRIHRASRKG